MDKGLLFIINKYGWVQVPAKSVPDSELREMFDIVDADSGGTISKEEFLELMTASEHDEEAMARQRNASTAGQLLHRIIEHAAEKHANLMYDATAVCVERFREFEA
eukprot:COSAG05_NODE_1923_length_3830_cov_4.180113_6_plen_106_part_00